MAKFVKGDVVVVAFPFSDLSQTKKRPALVVARVSPSDFILCQITSQATRDANAILLKSSDFESGTLRQESFIRPNRLFTANDKIALYRAARVKPAKLDAVVNGIIKIIKSD